MSKTIEAQGEYKVKSTGEMVQYDFEYVAFDSLEEAIEQLTEAEVLKRVQRMTKVDASNTARESAKVANGHSSRKAMSEEEKAEAKAKRAQDKALLDKIKHLSPEQLAKLGL